MPVNRRLHYHLLDVFTEERFGGNQLAVFTNGRGLSAVTMQQIAKELNLSETVFVLPPENPQHEWRIRIFTPARELPMAGHPTVGTAYVLRQEHLVNIPAAGGQITLEEQVGPIPVHFDASGLIVMGQPLPTFGPVFEDRAAMAALLGLNDSDLLPLPLEVVSSGVPFVFIPVQSLEAIGRIKLRLDLWEQHLQHYAAPHLFAFTMQTVDAAHTVHSRMFAPAMGIAEDPATGAASGPLGCYLVKQGLAQPGTLISEQGYEMGRPSQITIRIATENGNFTRVEVGGRCVPTGEGFIII
jgi:trans-2,3-dihydro-3-hydroxyanthranilate isomerase